MTEDKHMQKAREVGIDIRVASKLRWPREASRLWATADAIEDMDELIASALSEAYRSGVGVERERAANIAEEELNRAAEHFDKADVAHLRTWHSACGAIARHIATAIRTTKAD